MGDNKALFRPIDQQKQIDSLLNEVKELMKLNNTRTATILYKRAVTANIEEKLFHELKGRIGDSSIDDLLALHKQLSFTPDAVPSISLPAAPLNNKHLHHGKHGRRSKN